MSTMIDIGMGVERVVFVSFFGSSYFVKRHRRLSQLRSDPLMRNEAGRSGFNW
jgi:hypothetical protein